jgi:predicted Zn-dependent protease
MKEFGLADTRYLDAAQGWLGLGDWHSAQQELESISGPMQNHPDVLRVRWLVYAAATKWDLAAEAARALCLAAPESAFGFVHLAYALHEQKQTREAWNVLLPVVDKFPDEFIIRYNLACYACQLGDLTEAWRWLQQAVTLGGKPRVKKMAQRDRDLEPMRERIMEM